jgi:chitinase
VSYDDEDTFRQRIEYANATGLGGVAIWAIDLDTHYFQALQGLLGASNKTLNSFRDQNVNANYWQDSPGGQCKPSFLHPASAFWSEMLCCWQPLFSLL